jgi:hypothetical protein
MPDTCRDGKNREPARTGSFLREICLFLRGFFSELAMYRGIQAIEQFMESIGLTWSPGSTERAELKVSYRIGNTRPLGIDRTLVEFHCDPKRAKVWVPEFSRTSFHQWFEVPYQEFEFTPGGSMLKIKAPARGNAPPYSVGIKPLA